MQNILNDIRTTLIDLSDKKNMNGKRFFKEEINLLGVKAHNIHKLSKDVFKIISHKSKDEILSICDALWQTTYIEEALIACDLSFFIYKKYEPTDFVIFEKWIKNYISNWATCDAFCTHTMAKFIVMYPEFVPKVVDFCDSSNIWARRAGAVSFVIPAKKGMFQDTVIKICDKLFFDKEDLVQKGYGWLLKVTSQYDQNLVFEYVMENKKNMPRTSLRYALEKMPRDLKALAMAK